MSMKEHVIMCYSKEQIFIFHSMWKFKKNKSLKFPFSFNRNTILNKMKLEMSNFNN